jgi:hypothetical protein
MDGLAPVEEARPPFIRTAGPAPRPLVAQHALVELETGGEGLVDHVVIGHGWTRAIECPY